ncbi:hypothetical protein ABZZ01_35005, partial [Streptomyces virginiae]|uniref:hypothetical protein n=1 Tax=Streptomyces virginiae TaxID=1961 RepID=UPI0033A1F930
MTRTPHARPDEATLEDLRSAFPAEWREPALGHPAVEAWEAANGVSPTGRSSPRSATVSAGKTNMVHVILAGFARAEDILTWVI